MTAHGCFFEAAQASRASARAHMPAAAEGTRVAAWSLAHARVATEAPLQQPLSSSAVCWARWARALEPRCHCQCCNARRCGGATLSTRNEPNRKGCLTARVSVLLCTAVQANCRRTARVCDSWLLWQHLRWLTKGKARTLDAPTATPVTATTPQAAGTIPVTPYTWAPARIFAELLKCTAAVPCS